MKADYFHTQNIVFGTDGRTAVTVHFASSPPSLTLDTYLSLPEIESSLCPECGRPGAAVNDVLTCGEHQPFVQWRWPGVVGLD